jgi:hypothetical protein
MSRGHGQLQRWLLANVERNWQYRDTVGLAREYYGAMPTPGQVSSVRRALRLLERDGYVVGERTSWHGRPYSWRLVDRT